MKHYPKLYIERKKTKQREIRKERPFPLQHRLFKNLSSLLINISPAKKFPSLMWHFSLKPLSHSLDQTFFAICPYVFFSSLSPLFNLTLSPLCFFACHFWTHRMGHTVAIDDQKRNGWISTAILEWVRAEMGEEWQSKKAPLAHTGE